MGHYILSYKHLNVAFEIRYAPELGILTGGKNSVYVSLVLQGRNLVTDHSEVISEDVSTEEDYLGPRVDFV